MKKVHLVSFTNPYPPDYGGVIDVFYKIKALQAVGVKIILHIFKYDRKPSPELLNYCESVYYYTRKTGMLSQFSFLPYITKSRELKELLSNLCKDEYPILFEGLHTCFYLDHPSLKNRQKLVRMHNIEHEYYLSLSRATMNIFNSVFFRLESLKLRQFEKVLMHANHILAISQTDSSYLDRKFGKTTLISAFHSNEEVSSLVGSGKFILMHGNMKVEENITAVLHCINNIFNQIDFPVVIAGKDPSVSIKEVISQHPNIVLVENPDDSEMDRLQHEAHIHLCYTFQSSGLKLKLLNSLYKGRHVVANPTMTDGSGLSELTYIGVTDKDIVNKIKDLIAKPFLIEDVLNRKLVLQRYDNQVNAEKILSILNTLD